MERARARRRTTSDLTVSTLIDVDVDVDLDIDVDVDVDPGGPFEAFGRSNGGDCGHYPTLPRLWLMARSSCEPQTANGKPQTANRNPQTARVDHLQLQCYLRALSRHNHLVTSAFPTRTRTRTRTSDFYLYSYLGVPGTMARTQQPYTNTSLPEVDPTSDMSPRASGP